jgi:hypothetical protein
LQQMQQQQMAQQQAQPQGPMPVPAGVPQPEPQPEAMMARGGLASIPVRSDMFEYADGGIVAFQSGGQPKKYETPYDRMNRENREASTEKKPLDAEAQKALEEAQRSSDRGAVMGAIKKLAAAGYDIATLIPRAAMGVTEDLANTRLGRALGVDFQLPEAAYGGNRASMTPMLDRVSAAAAEGASPVTRPNVTAETMKRVGSMTAPKFGDPRMPAGLPGAAQQMSDKPAPTPPLAAPKPPVAAAPAPAAAPQPGLPGAAAAMSPQDEVAKLSMEAVREKAKAMTPEEAMAQEGKFASQYGLDKKFGEEERGLLALMKQRQADFAKRRPMEELGATLRGFGQGYGGASAAGERAGRETYEMDMANQREALNAINALNKENLATGKERYKFGSGLFGKSEESAAAANRQRMETLGSMSNKDKEVANAAENRLNNLEVEKLRIAERQAERNQPGSASKVRAEYLKMMDQVFALEDKGEKAQADALRRRADARLTAGGGTGTAGVGAERNDISRKRLQIQTWEKIRDSSSDPAAIQEAEKSILQLARDIAKIESGEGGGNAFTVTAGGKTYTFPTQEAANKFKAEAGVK